jgi:hypothetical protein
MNIIRSWREIKIMLKRRFSILSNGDFEFVEGDKERMMDSLAAKLQKTRSELDSLLTELQKH